MFRKIFFQLMTFLTILLVAACNPAASTPVENSPAAIANPASVFCEQNGGKLEIRQDDNGGQIGICLFPDGTSCEEWAYMRGECKPGDANKTPLLENGWKLYKNETSGLSFLYPADATIETNNPDQYVSVVGPLANNEHWPVFYINYPSDRSDYRPPEGTDLVKWLTDNNLLVDTRQPDIRIAGTLAIHTRFETDSGQSYANDTYYFVHGGQLYQVIVLHAGKEDWNVYNQFLESIQFE